MELPSEISYQKSGRVATITINRPEARNALTLEMLDGLTAAFDDFNQDDDLWVAILTGTGDRAFCAGGDLGRTTAKVAEGVAVISPDPTKRFFSDVFKPIIGAVNGPCIGGGLEILQGTDLRVAVEHATFGLGEVRWGVVPSGGSHIRLPRQIPWAVAMEILLTGRTIDAQRALQIGLVNRVVPKGNLMVEAQALADVVCSNGPIAVRTAKEIAVRALNLERGFVLESALKHRVFKTEDAREGPRAFLEKRQPNFVGR